MLFTLVHSRSKRVINTGRLHLDSFGLFPSKPFADLTQSGIPPHSFNENTSPSFSSSLISCRLSNYLTDIFYLNTVQYNCITVLTVTFRLVLIDYCTITQAFVFQHSPIWLYHCINGRTSRSCFLSTISQNLSWNHTEVLYRSTVRYHYDDIPNITSTDCSHSISCYQNDMLYCWTTPYARITVAKRVPTR